MVVEATTVMVVGDGIGNSRVVVVVLVAAGHIGDRDGAEVATVMMRVVTMLQ